MHPAEPIDRIEPAEPIDKIEPAEPIDRIDPADPIDWIEPGDPIDWIEPRDLMLRTERGEPTERNNRIATFSQPSRAAGQRGRGSYSGGPGRGRVGYSAEAEQSRSGGRAGLRGRYGAQVDRQEEEAITSRVDQARLDKLLAEQDLCASKTTDQRRY